VEKVLAQVLVFDEIFLTFQNVATQNATTNKGIENLESQ